MADQTQDIPLNPQGVEAAYDAFLDECSAVGGCGTSFLSEGGWTDALNAAIRAYLPHHHQPAPVPPVTAEDDSVSSALDIAYLDGVMTERAHWRRATGVGHWSDYHRPARILAALTTPPALTREQEEVERIRDALTDAVGGLRYIEQAYGRLYGVGWDRVYAKYAALDVAPETREGE